MILNPQMVGDFARKLTQVFLEFVFESVSFLSAAEVVDDVYGVGKENALAFQTGGIAQGGGQMGFAKPHGAEKDDVGVLFHKQESKEGLHLESVDTLGPVPLELFELSLIHI